MRYIQPSVSQPSSATPLSCWGVLWAIASLFPLEREALPGDCAFLGQSEISPSLAFPLED